MSSTKVAKMDANTLNKNTFILMRKLFTFVCLSAFSVAFAQSKKTKFVNFPKETLYKMFSNSAAAKNQYSTLTEDERKKQFEDYYCLIKKYKIDFSEDSNFLKETEINKVYNKIFAYNKDLDYTTHKIEALDLIWTLQMGFYKRREDFYDSHKKCLNKDEYYWNPQENQ